MAPPGPRTLGGWELDSLVGRAIALQPENCGLWSPGFLRVLVARKGCGGRADEPTFIPTLFRSKTAFIYVGVLVKFHLKNVPSC